MFELCIHMFRLCIQMFCCWFGWVFFRSSFSLLSVSCAFDFGHSRDLFFCVVLLLGKLGFCSYLSIAPLVLLLSRGFVPKQVSCFQSLLESLY